jgi:1-acyl-sn-glycerol-3-phosphate acyltransferase
LRGVLTLALVGVLFVALDLAERLIVVPLLRVRPAARERILGSWMRLVANLTLSVVAVSGARVELPARISCKRPTLLVMNHQSLLDIPAAVACLDRGPLRFVTRRSYARGIPLVSHMLRLYDCPLVDPRRPSREEVASLQKTSETTSSPLLIFPEGSRTRDGSIGPFKRAGLRAILGARDWSVYLVVGDGFWRCGALRDFARNVGGIRGRVTWVGPLLPPRESERLDEFIVTMQDRMSFILNEMRNSPKVVHEDLARGPQ